MHADREDAPPRLQTARSSNTPLLIGLGVGVLISAGGLMLGSDSYRALAPDAPVVTSSRPAAMKPPLPQELPPPVNTVAVTPPGSPPAISSRHESSPPARPNSFNEHNYQPAGAINNIPPVQRSSIPPATRSQPPMQGQVLSTSGFNSRDQAPPIRHQSHWRWDRQQGSFLWVESNGSIDWTSVCSNYRRGSLEYRDCRKGAKLTFAEICRRDASSPACSADNHYSPL